MRCGQGIWAGFVAVRCRQGGGGWERNSASYIIILIIVRIVRTPREEANVRVNADNSRDPQRQRTYLLYEKT